MPSYKLDEDTSIQKSVSRPYYFLLKKVDVFIPEAVLSEKTPLFSKPMSAQTITLYSRDEKHYSMLGQALSDYKEIHDLEHNFPLPFTCKKNTPKKYLQLSGDFIPFIEFLRLNNYMSSSLLEKIKNLLTPIENKSQENTFSSITLPLQ